MVDAATWKNVYIALFLWEYHKYTGWMHPQAKIPPKTKDEDNNKTMKCSTNNDRRAVLIRSDDVTSKTKTLSHNTITAHYGRISQKPDGLSYKKNIQYILGPVIIWPNIVIL